MRNGLNLPLSSMRLLVPPVRLMSAYMWQVAQQRCVDQYGKLAEFISLVTQMVPELLSFRQRAQLILGLRARLTLELLQSVETFDPQAIQDTLNTISQWTTNCMQEEGLEEEVEISKLTFVELVQTLLDDPSEMNNFFKYVFPVQYGARFDTTLQILVWEFLSRLEEFLPVPSFSQIVSCSSPTLLDSDEVEPFFSDAEDLKMLLEHHRQHKKLKKNLFSFESDTILSTLASKHTSELCKDQDEHTMKNTRALVDDQQKSERSLQRRREKEERKTSQQENKLSERDGHEEDEEGSDEGSDEAVGSNFHQQQEEEPSPLRAPLSSPETDSEVPVDLLFLGNNCLEVPVTDERKVKCHLRRKDINPEVERIQDSTGDGAEDLLPSSRPNSCSTEITKRHSCPQCGKSFKMRCDMKRHQDTVHVFVRPFECNQCQKRFKTKYTLKKHLEIHTGHKPYLCSYCGRGFRDKTTLKEHVYTHTGERPYACTLCEKKFTQQNILRGHLRLHKGERPYLCSDCGKTFCESGALLVHSRQHTGERPYHCDVCGKSYYTLQMLKTHQRYHTGERPYACAYCEKCFRIQSGLAKHTRTHTGEKPFQCLKCDKRFSVKSNMRVHLRSHR